MAGEADEDRDHGRGAHAGSPNRYTPPAAPWRPVVPLLAAGAIAIVAGGLLAAAVAHAPGRTAVWLSAFLVLVVGVVQVTLAAGQVALVGPGAGRGIARWELALYNLASAGVIAGTMARSLVLVALGTGLFLAAR